MPPLEFHLPMDWWSSIMWQTWLPHFCALNVLTWTLAILGTKKAQEFMKKEKQSYFIMVRKGCSSIPESGSERRLMISGSKLYTALSCMENRRVEFVKSFQSCASQNSSSTALDLTVLGFLSKVQRPIQKLYIGRFRFPPDMLFRFRTYTSSYMGHVQKGRMLEHPHYHFW